MTHPSFAIFPIFNFSVRMKRTPHVTANCSALACVSACVCARRYGINECNCTFTPNASDATRLTEQERDTSSHFIEMSHAVVDDASARFLVPAMRVQISCDACWTHTHARTLPSACCHLCLPEWKYTRIASKFIFATIVEPVERYLSTIGFTLSRWISPSSPIGTQQLLGHVSRSDRTLL